MERLAVSLLAAFVLPAAAAAQEQRDWPTTGQMIAPRAADLVSRDLTPPLLDPITREQRDWLITGQIVPRVPDLISRDLTPPPLDLATTQVAPGQWLYLPPEPRQIPQAELDQIASGMAPGAPNGPRPLVPAVPYVPYLPGSHPPGMTIPDR